MDSHNAWVCTHDRFEATKEDKSNMIKSLLVCALLWHKLYEIDCHVERVPIDQADQGETEEVENLPVLPVFKNPVLDSANWSSNFARGDEGIATDYITVKGIGAFKVHRIQLDWNSARQICTEEGGHLAILRSRAEVEIVRELIYRMNYLDVWVGLHDQFEEGDWISVLDEPIREIGGAFWSSYYAQNPDNWYNNQNCARVLLYDGGMDDFRCNYPRPFVCKIS